MKQVLGKPEDTITGPLHFWLEDGGGYEGVCVMLRSRMAHHGRFEEILVTDIHGKVWIGNSHSIFMGHFKPSGEFVLNPAIGKLDK